PQPTPAPETQATPAPEGGEAVKPLTADPKKEPAPTEPTKLMPAEPAAASATFPGERAQLSPTTIATFPTDIVAVGGTPSLQGLVASFSGQLKNMPNAQVPPDPLPMAIGAI